MNKGKHLTENVPNFRPGPTLTEWRDEHPWHIWSMRLHVCEQAVDRTERDRLLEMLGIER